MKAFLILLACAFASTLFSQSNIQQSVSVNGTGNAPDPSAQLDVSATDKGMLVPRMSSTLRGAIASPANGLLVYDTNTNSFWHFNGTAWVNLTTARTLQDADGNTKVQVEENPNENTIRFDVNGNEAMVIDPTGRVGIGTGAPAQKLDILGGNPDEGAILQMSNSDRTKFFRLFSGRENDANPFLNWQDGTDFRFATSNNNFSGFMERMRLTANGSLGIGTPTPDASALLDVQSATKGVLVPRMMTTQRTAIASPATGLLVYDTDTNAFWFYNGTAWAKISPQTVLADADGDTKIQVEKSPDEDIIRFDLGGTEEMVLRKNANGASRLELPDLAHNTIIGKEAGVNNIPALGTWGEENLFIGYRAGNANTTGSNNSFTGSKAGSNNMGGSDNTASGSSALYSNTTGNDNTASGRAALYSNTTGSSNTASGLQALYSNTEGDYNTASGTAALYSNKANSRSTAIGTRAMFNADNRTINEQETFNTAVGYEALKGSGTPADNIGRFNTAVGDRALFANTTGENNTASGSSALSSNTTGSYNTATGHTALSANTTGISNTANGYLALRDNTTGDQNTATGREALLSNTTGDENVATGIAALQDNTTGFNNTATGAVALQNNTTGIENTATGAYALQNATTANSNTANGAFALQNTTTGNFNTANGHIALQNNTTGSQNTAIGVQALTSNTTGQWNTAIGVIAGDNNTTGTDILCVGWGANVSSSGLSDATAIGEAALCNASNKIRLGNAGITVIEGQVDFTFPSDARFKFNVHDETVPGLAFINKLRPVTYQFDTRKFDQHLMQHIPDSARQQRLAKQDYSESTALVQTGFLAQEVEQACKDLNFTFSGLHIPESNVDNYGLAYGSFVPLLVKGMQEQQVEIEIGKSEIEKLKAENAALKSRLETQAAQLEKITAALAGAGIAVEK